MAFYHTPVMLDESIYYLDINPDGIYVDVTFGGGGHTKAILEKLSSKGKVFGFDQDADSIANVIEDERFVFVNQNFAQLKNYMIYYNYAEIDGLIADLGVSSFQIDTPEKGFSYHYPNESLDMRMSSLLTNTAADILNQYSVESLTEIFSKYGEEFLATNKTQAGVKTTASGLQYKVIREGSGPKPTATSNVTVHYEGKLIDGSIFDSSYERGEPITFGLNQVIPGWTEGLQLMNSGSEYQLFIPSDLGYGDRNIAGIPGGSVLIFKVELLSFE
jgi:FKBP-type peptidyl-prolyl cis-trans isomerase